MMPFSLQLAEHVSADGILKDIAMVSHVMHIYCHVIAT